ncbi:MAG: sulfatase-like hydrolase/transferase [Fimbriimonadaceae bacterium]|nr:sulfatase-like hydrolase/transferase [Fimbriimonadaceae bacterium]
MDQPNLLLILADQHRWDLVGWEANGVTLTPHLDALAARGTRCRSTYCTAPLCSPSRAALASGRYGANTGCFTNLHDLPAHTPTFINQLRTAGYQTACVGKTHLAIHAYDADYTSPDHRAYLRTLGWDETCEVAGNGLLKTGLRCEYSQFLRDRGRFADVLEFYRQWHYFMEPGRRGDPDFTCHAWPFEEELHETAFIGQRAGDWLAGRDRQRPFLLHVGFTAPHSPVEPLPRWLDRYASLAEPPPWGDPQPPESRLSARRGYRALISEIDETVGMLVDQLATAGDLANTVIVYTADHGEMAGDHGRCGKTCFFEGSVRVPLVVAGPGVKHQESAALVELLDLGSTLCDLAGVPAHDLDQGRSLRPLLAGETASHRATVYAEMGCDRMLCDGQTKLMWGDPALDQRRLGRLHLDKPVTIPASPGRLYDLVADPHETRNLLDEPAAAGLAAEWQQRLLARFNENTQPRPSRSRGAYRPITAA